MVFTLWSETEKVNHYRIDFMVNYYKFGGRMFADVPSIISFFKEHSLEKTTLNNMVSIVRVPIRIVFECMLLILASPTHDDIYIVLWKEIFLQIKVETLSVSSHLR